MEDDLTEEETDDKKGKQKVKPNHPVDPKVRISPQMLIGIIIEEYHHRQECEWGTTAYISQTRALKPMMPFSSGCYGTILSFSLI